MRMRRASVSYNNDNNNNDVQPQTPKFLQFEKNSSIKRHLLSPDIVVSTIYRDVIRDTQSATAISEQERAKASNNNLRLGCIPS